TDQLSLAIDSYRKIPRQSNLLEDALYEISWAYVKNKNYPQALQSLELLAMSDPNSDRLPDVRILEGNLRIRLARARVLNGESDGQSDYQQALKTFDELKAYYAEPHKELHRIIDEHADPKRFLAQITGRSSRALETQAPLPPIAAAWLKEEA